MATLDRISVDITVVLGTTSMPIHQCCGSVAAPSSNRTSRRDPASVLANGLPVAKGTVVMNGNRIAVGSGNCWRVRRTCAESLRRQAPTDRVLFPPPARAQALSLRGIFVTCSAVLRTACPPPHAVVAELVDALA